MGRWGWEGNKAVSWEYFRLPLSLFRNAHKKKAFDSSFSLPPQPPMCYQRLKAF